MGRSFGFSGCARAVALLLAAYGCSGSDAGVVGGADPGDGASASDGDSSSTLDAGGETDALVGDDAPADARDSGPGDGGVGVGTVTTSACAPDAGVPGGGTCTHLDVDCTAVNGIPPLGATVIIVEPTVPVTGTVFLLNGGPGTMLIAPKPELLAAGLRHVALAWDSAWEDSPNGGILAAACRPVTAMKWAFDHPHQGARSTAFCAQGASAGSGAISYALAHYGMGEYLDYAALVSGPPFGRIDYGCAPSTYTGPPRTVCEGANGALSPAPYAYQGGALGGPIALINGGERTTTCGSANPPAADLARWAKDSVVSPGATYDYPKTPVRMFFCTSATTNEVTGLGSFFYEQIVSSKSMGCYTSCTAEMVGQDPAGKADISSSMLANCIPRHR